jgi:dienelactone hydrolase
MHRLICRSLIVLAFALPLAAQQPPANPQPAFDPINTKIFYRVAGMDQVKVTEGVVYRTVDGAELKMDVYAPPAGPPRPAVLFVSGGAETRAWGLYKDYGRITAASDLVAIIYDKRYPPNPTGVQTAADDTLELAKYLRANAGKYNIDPQRICLWTFSAGGSLAQVGLNPEYGFQCVVAYYGLGQAGPRLMLQQQGDKIPPTLLVRAGRDNAMLNNAVDVFASLALGLNAPITVLNYPAGVHAFEVEDLRPEPKEPANVAETGRILRFTLDWIKSQAGR